MNSLDTNKSPKQLQNDVHTELGKVRRDIENLKNRLSPGQVIDEVIFLHHDRSPGATFEHLKRNPIGTAFLSLGTLMLMEDENHVSYEKNARTKVSSMAQNLKEHMPHKSHEAGQVPNTLDRVKAKVTGLKDEIQTKASGIKQTVQHRGTDLKQNLQSKAQSLKEEMGHKSSELKETLESKKDQFGEQFQNQTDRFASDQESNFAFTSSTESSTSNLSSTTEEVKGRFENVQSRLSTGYEKGKEKIQNLDPMAYVALGAGLGALTGASLPISQAEREMVDNKLGERFSNFNQDLQNAVNESANVLKDLVISDVKGFSMDLFR